MKEFDKLNEIFYEWQALKREEQQPWKDERQKTKAATFIQNYWRRVLARKELQRLKQEAYETSIILIGNSRMKHLEERANDTIQERIEQENLDSSVIVPTVQFYGNNL